LTAILLPVKFWRILEVSRTFSPSTRIKLGGILKKASMVLPKFAIKRGCDAARDVAKDTIVLFERIGRRSGVL
jgi:hypothetical protein